MLRGASAGPRSAKPCSRVSYAAHTTLSRSLPSSPARIHQAAPAVRRRRVHRPPLCVARNARYETNRGPYMRVWLIKHSCVMCVLRSISGSSCVRDR